MKILASQALVGVRFNGIDAPSGWVWDEVHSSDHSDAVVNWTLPAGPHTLEIAKA